MIVPEKTAQEIDCPMTFANPKIFPDLDSDGEEKHEPLDTSCRASFCMAWRFFDSDEVDKPREERLGYCGLAGKPSEGLS